MPADGTTATASALASKRLADVLAALTHEPGDAFDAAWWRRNGLRAGRPFGDHGPIADLGYGCVPWLTTPEARHPDGAVTPAHLITPAEALEMLATRGAWPWEVGADDAPRWHCEWCGGEGSRVGPYGTAPCPWCFRGTISGGTFTPLGHTDAPPSLPALVSAAACVRLREAVQLARELAGSNDAVVVLRVMGREAIERHHELTARDGDGLSVAYVTSHEHERSRRTNAYGGQPAWPEMCPWVTQMSHVQAAWPALRALTATGAHLLDLAPGRVTLGIEAAGSQ